MSDVSLPQRPVNERRAGGRSRGGRRRTRMAPRKEVVVGNPNRRGRYWAVKSPPMVDVIDRPRENPIVDSVIPVRAQQRKLAKIKQYSSTGGDLRNPLNARRIKRDDQLSGQSGKINIDMPCITSTLNAIGVSMISHAMVHGWRFHLEDDDVSQYLAFALRYIVDTLSTVITGTSTTMPKVKVPLFFRDICAAIAPKSSKMFGAGTLSYKWTLLDNGTVQSAFSYPSNGGATFLLGTTTGQNELDGFPEMQAINMANYTAAEGEQAFSSLVNYMDSSYTRKGYNPWRKVDFVFETSSLRNDVSAFSYISKVFGKGETGGFVSSLASSQVHISTPIVACMADSQAISTYGFRQHRQVSGDANSMVGSFLLMKNEREYHNKNYVVWKFIDFFELADRYARALAVAFQNYYNSSTQSGKITNTGLTGLQFLLLLKAHIMRIFDWQFMGQTMYPTGLSTSQTTFKPFICSSTTTGGYAYEPLTVPLFMAENVKALLPRAVFPDIIPGRRPPYKTNSNAPRWYMPVWGYYGDYEFNIPDFTYNNGTTNVPIFLNDNIEIDINTGFSSQNNMFVEIGAPKRINELTRIHNACVTELSAFIQQPTALVGDDAPNALCALGITNIIIPVVSEGEEEEDGKGRRERGLIGPKKQVKVPQVKVKDKALQSITAQQPLLSSTWNIQKAWIIPELPFFQSGQGVGTVDADVAKVYNIEPWSVILGNDAQLKLLPKFSEIRDWYVTRCVKNFNAEDCEEVKLLLKAAEGGEGGILGAVISAFKDVAPPALRIGANIIDSF